MKDYVLQVEGMSCNHCKMTVESTAKGVAGVKNAVVDLKKGTLNVSFEGDDLSPVKEAVTEAGYPVK